MNKPEEILLQAIKGKVHDNRPFPTHVELKRVKTAGGYKRGKAINVIEPATNSIDLAILKFTIHGEIPPEKLVEIYPDQKMLRRYLMTTMNYFLIRSDDPEVKNYRELADGINDLMVLRMVALPGWDG